MILLHGREEVEEGRSAEAIYAELHRVMAPGWRTRMDEVAALLVALRKDLVALRSLIAAAAARGEWPAMEGAQSFFLVRTHHMLLRANLWFPMNARNPAIDSLRRYLSVGELHNHDFSFFTICLLGSGYRTHFYTDRNFRTDLHVGDRPELEDQGVMALSGNDVLFVERDVDYHLQHWPETFSVTLNLIPELDPSNKPFQYILDSDSLRIKTVVGA